MDGEDGQGDPTRRTIWRRIEAQLPPAERDEVRRLIGNDLVEKNEGLLDEVELHREILNEFQQQNARVREQLAKRRALPELPARSLLEQQIALLINSVKHNAENSSSVRQLLSPKSRADQQILNHVLKRHDCGLRLPLDGSRSGGGNCHSSRQTRPSTASSSRSGSSSASAPADILIEGGKLSLRRIEALANDINRAMQDESLELLEEIDYIQSLLDMEHEEIMEEKNAALKPPPDLDDMRAYTQKLERTWLMEDSIQGSIGALPTNALSLRGKPVAPLTPRKGVPLHAKRLTESASSLKNEMPVSGKAARRLRESVNQCRSAAEMKTT